YPKITNRQSSSENILAAKTNHVKVEVQAIKTNEVNDEKTDAQVEALTKQESVGARVKWEDTFGVIDIVYQLIKNKLKFLFDIIAADAKATKGHHEKGRKQGRKKITKNIELLYTNCQKEVYEQVLLRLFDCFSIKDDLAGILFPRESMLKRAEDAIVTTIQSYSSDSKTRKRVENK
ncbi:hypothetical protein RFI_04086, partial [Reticulomyxa filosa]